MKLVKLPDNNDAIEFARDLLARCESGETVELMALEVYQGGNYGVGSSSVKSQLWTAGALLEMAVTRLRP